MTIYRMDSEEEALFRSSPYAVYYVQSPSTVSHANSAEFRNLTNETMSETFAANNPAASKDSAANRLALSHYSSSRGSTNSFLHGKKIPYGDDVQSQGTGVATSFHGDANDDDHHHHHHHDQISNTIDVNSDHDHHRQACRHGGYKVDHDGQYYEEDDEEYFERNFEWRRMLSFSYSDSPGWKLLQITWRFIVSMIVAVVVFYIITKPPAPSVSVEISRLAQFELAEGVDTTGVTTKMLTCNCSVEVTIDNNSKLFRLHVHPPFLAMSFGNLPFAAAQGGSELKVGVDGINYLRLFVGTRKKPMYGAGRSMQDLLESKEGLPLAMEVELRSSFEVLWGLIKPKFHHRAHCLIVVADAYDKKHRTQHFISKCTLP